MPSSGAASTARRTASPPALCPDILASPLALAQRPFPSMMIPTCSPFELSAYDVPHKALCIIKLQSKKNSREQRAVLIAPAVSSSPNESLHMIKVAFEGAPPGRGQAIISLWQAAFEVFVAGNVTGFLELSRMNAEVTVGCAQ